MIRDALYQFPMAELTTIGLLLFVLAFGIIVSVTYRKGNKELFESMGRLPLEDDEPRASS